MATAGMGGPAAKQGRVMECPRCHSPHLFVSAGATPRESSKTCFACGEDSPFTVQDWLEHLAEKAGESTVRDAVRSLQTGDGDREQALAQLADAARHLDGRAAMIAVQSLGAAPCERSVTALADVANRPDQELSRTAISQLGALRIPVAAEALFRLLEECHRDAALVEESIVTCSEAAVPSLADRLMAASDDESQRWVRLLSAIGGESALRALCRWRVRVCLQGVERRQVSPVDAGERLAALGYRAIAPLLDALEAEDSRVRLSALRGLLELDRTAAQRAAEKCAHDCCREVAEYARYQLDHLRGGGLRNAVR